MYIAVSSRAVPNIRFGAEQWAV